MSLCIRSSACVIQSMKRTLCTSIAQSQSFLENSEESARIQSRKAIYLRKLIDADLIINQKLKTDQTIEEKQWAAVREELKNSFQLTDVNVDSQIYDICFYYSNLGEALNYFKFLESNNYKLNLNIVGTYLRIFYLRKKPITEEEEEEILRVYDDLRKEYSLLDAKTCSDCILALSLTKRWKETLELKDMLEFASSSGSTVLSSIICAAFRNNDPKLGWKILNETIAKHSVDSSVYTAYLNYCVKYLDVSEWKDNIDKIFHFWRENAMTPNELVIKEYANFYQSFGYTASYTSVNMRGCCSSCKYSLQVTELNKSDFKTLSVLTLKNMIIGKSVYCSTSPQELKRYMLFVQTMKPYDVVIDGLNVAYAGRIKNQPASLQSILEVVNYFLIRSKKRILVIGRVHMNWWSKEQMTTLREKADVFLIKNLSEDDPFLLHVTLMSGPQTYFVSRDLMRQHKNKLVDSNLQMLFKRWQMSRQYLFKKSKLSKKITLVPPLTYDPNAQKDDNGWHIPYTNNMQLQLPDEYIPSKAWVCMRKKKSDA